MRLLCLIFALSIETSCGSSPQPPVVNPPTTVETITGSERIGWDQPAADAAELATIRYALYVDDARTELAGVTCASTRTANGFACSGRLPSLTRGAHTLQIASFTADGAVLESTRSAALRVNVVAAGTSAAGAATVRPGPVASPDGTRMRVELVTDGLDTAADLAFTPDGRILVAEAAGRIRIVRNGQLLRDPAITFESRLGGTAEKPGAGRLLALATDPQFSRTHFVYAVFSARARSGDMAFTIARLREAGDTLGDVVPLVGDIPAAATPAAAMRFGADGKLYVALDAGGDTRRVGDNGSSNGKLLRMNADGTTPPDQAGGTPIYAAGAASPVGLAWQPAASAWWIADRNDGKPLLRSIVQDFNAAGGRRRGVAREAYALPADVMPSAMAVYQANVFSAWANSLLVGSAGGTRLLRIAIDPQTGRPSTTERLLQDRVDGISALGISPEGAIYFTTTNALGRIVKE